MQKSVSQLGLVSLLLLSSACSGSLFIKAADPNALPPGSYPCNFLNPTGLCTGAGQTCVSGVCTSNAQACSLSVPNGICPTGQACNAGVCQGITNPCGTTFPSGQCAGGQVCVYGYCYVDDGTVLCGPSNLNGACPDDSTLSCNNGQCVTYFPNCSDKDWGSCGTWKTCAAGTCVGPTPPDACSPSRPKGRCPVTDTCVAGTCQTITKDNACSSTNVTGLCAGNAVCSSLGFCVSITAQTACSTTNVTGACSGGALCVNGQCAAQSCESGTGYACSKAGQVCMNKACQDSPCTPANPSGTCVDNAGEAEVCIDGLCGTPLCDAQNPNGRCQSVLTCLNGACTAPPCSPNSLYGPCPDNVNYACDHVRGVCVQKACSAQSPGGSCTGTSAVACTKDPYYGCLHFSSAVCCDNTESSSTGCVVGSCTAPACSPSNPNGLCPLNQICDATVSGGSCVTAPCSPYFPGGTCPTGQTCSSGKCSLPDCSSQQDPNAYCSPKVCKSNVCVDPPCSPAHPEGTCDGGKACCDHAAQTTGDPNYDPACAATSIGSCFTPSCSAKFPGGTCLDGNNRCANGNCVPVPCSPAYPHGPCGPNFSCDPNHGVCVLVDCAQSQGRGKCSNANQICSAQGNGSYACVPYTCSNAFPHAPCVDTSQQCTDVNNNVNNPNYQCRYPSCSPNFPGGQCNDQNTICSNGNCITPGCSKLHPYGVCPRSQNCNSTLGACVAQPCSQADPNDSGFCAPQSGKQYACCNTKLLGYPGCANANNFHTCLQQTCSSQFPFAPCSNSNQICVSGSFTCQNVCNATNKTGYCPGGFACVEGACAPPCTNDQDCDTISDSDEGIGTLVDTDHDGVPDAFDHDSDGDLIPDAVEAGDKNLSTPPRATIPGKPNFRSIDSDGDYISDTVEAGPAPGVPRDTDSDGAPDYIDTDSDNDGILDRCEAKAVSGSLCGNSTLITMASQLTDSTPTDNLPDFRSKDSDGDGVPDTIEARAKPADPTTLNPNGVDHNGDGVPDYRDLDSDGDGVADIDEDVNGDGIVNCQVDGTGNPVVDNRPNPTCNSTSSPFSSSQPYDYNPGCVAHSNDNTYKCVLAETNRVFNDTDGNGIQDGQDGVFQVCSTANLKPINVFYSQVADYAFALEQSYTSTTVLNKSGSQIGMSFDDPNTANGSYAVSGFLINRTPAAAAINATNSNPNQVLTTKALAQAQADYAQLSAMSGVKLASQVTSRNFVSYDGYGVAQVRYQVIMTSNVSVGKMRDTIASMFAGSIDNFSPTDRGPSNANDFQVSIETLYRTDNGSNSGVVLSIGAVVQTGQNANSTATYNYRTQCNLQSTSSCASRPGCQVSGSSCVEVPAYQIPLFYTDNVTNGSAITQYGDDIASLCASMVQRNGQVDFLWSVDNSGSMEPKIGQVVRSAALFFPILANSEADYRVSMTTSSANSPYWPPIFPGCFGVTNRQQCENSSKYTNQTNQGGCSWDLPTGTCWPACTNNSTSGACTNPNRVGCVWTANSANPNGGACTYGGCTAITDPNTCTKQADCSWSSTSSSCVLVGTADLINGQIGDFTGAVAGLTTNSTDRSFGYSCSEGCTINTCAAYSSQASCAADLSCAWNTTTSKCYTNCCPSCAGGTSGTPNDPACYFAARLPNDTGTGNEYGVMMAQWALMRAGAQPICSNATNQASCSLSGCYWNGSACLPNYCTASYVSDGDPNVTNTAQAHCMAWQNGGSSIPPSSPISNAASNHYGEYENPSVCEWNPQAPEGAACFPSISTPCFTYSNATSCGNQGNRCAWTGNVCLPNEPGNRVLCSATSQSACVVQGNGFCQWDTCTSYTTSDSCTEVAGCGWTGSACTSLANGGTCRPPLKRMLRNNAAKIAVILSDEEECYTKDGPSSSGGGGTQYDGNCAGGQYSGGLMRYDDPVRIGRTNAYQYFMQSRGVTVFGLVGDKADPTKAPATTTVLGNGGCRNGYNAEAGQTYVNVAEGTSGGYGSLCAANLFPAIESVVITGLSQASPYKLEGFIDGKSVQPISATIKVAVQTCKVASEYPSCASGTQVQVVPRSRDNGFDYNPSTNTVLLYGSARAVTQGSITVSYRYWVNRIQPPGGTPSGCPCPETSGPGCACAPGKACGIQGNTNKCTPNSSSVVCNNTPGCVWNRSGNGTCVADGLCEPDPTCGGACAAGTVCDPSQGLCVCDVSCNGGCLPGSQCDNNANIHQCSGLSQSSCGGVTGCAWNATLGACLSATCGTCVCDTTCGGGCPAGQTCNTNVNSSTCGTCSCDTTCGGSCPANEACNTNTSSGTCGFCQPPACGNCPAGFVCNAAANICVCDTSCGGGTPAAGQACDSNTASPTCGQLICDKTCGGSCPATQVCDQNPGSNTCGFCIPDPTCGQPNGQCNSPCADAQDQNSCIAKGAAFCKWKSDINNNSGCFPAVCKVCDSANGFCSVDSSCAACGCNSQETCDPDTGACVCDTTCSRRGSCAQGTICNRDTTSQFCGQCICDTTCGGACPQGQICDKAPASQTCGQCVIDPYCGNGCPFPKVCNSSTGLCEVSTSCGGGCSDGFKCNTATGQCEQAAE